MWCIGNETDDVPDDVVSSGSVPVSVVFEPGARPEPGLHLVLGVCQRLRGQVVTQGYTTALKTTRKNELDCYVMSIICLRL